MITKIKAHSTHRILCRPRLTGRQAVTNAARFATKWPTILSVGIVAFGLAGCASNDPGSSLLYPATSLAASIENEPEFQKWVAKLRDDPELDYAWEYMLGDSLLYLPPDYRQQLTADKDTLIGVFLGTYVAKHPELDYERLNAAVTQCGLLCSELGRARDWITKEEFERYKTWGGIWLAGIRIGSNADAIETRYALFKQRAAEFGPYLYDDIRVLIWNDYDLLTFLINDDFARKWITANRQVNPEGPSSYGRDLDTAVLQPITDLHLPGLAS